MGWCAGSVDGCTGVLDGMAIDKGVAAGLGVNVRRPIVTSGDFATRLFPNYFDGQDLL